MSRADRPAWREPVRVALSDTHRSRQPGPAADGPLALETVFLRYDDQGDRRCDLIAKTSRTTRWLAYGLFVLAAGLMANSILGPLVADIIQYRYSTSLINQGIGLDAVALFVAGPAAVMAGLLLLRGHQAGPVLAFIPATFVAYMAPQYIVGPEYLEIPGNNEQFFLFHLAIFVLAVTVLFVAWTMVGHGGLASTASVSDRRLGVVMLGVVGFVALGRWLPAIADVMSGQPSSADYLENPTAFFVIGLLDLGLVVPAAVASFVGLRLRTGWARQAAYAVIGWFTLVPAAVAAMAVTMWIKDDSNITNATAMVFVVAAAIFTTGAALLYRPLFTAGLPEIPKEDHPAVGTPSHAGRQHGSADT